MHVTSRLHTKNVRTMLMVLDNQFQTEMLDLSVLTTNTRLDSSVPARLHTAGEESVDIISEQKFGRTTSPELESRTSATGGKHLRLQMSARQQRGLSIE